MPASRSVVSVLVRELGDVSLHPPRPSSVGNAIAAERAITAEAADGPAAR